MSAVLRTSTISLAWHNGCNVRRAGVDQHADDTSRARSDVGATPVLEVGAREKRCHDVLELFEACIAARVLLVPSPLLVKIRDRLVAVLREMIADSRLADRDRNLIGA
jgi:hypothetical protein